MEPKSLESSFLASCHCRIVRPKSRSITTHPPRFFPSGSLWRLILALLVASLAPSCSQHLPGQPNLQPRSPKTAQLRLNMAFLARFSSIWLPFGIPNLQKTFKNLMFLKVFQRFGVWNGSQIEENLAKMAMLSPSWVVLGDLGCKLGCLGRSWLQVGLSWEMLGARWSAMER